MMGQGIARVVVALVISAFFLNCVFQVHAKHEEKGDGKSVYKEYNREFLLPHGTDPESIQSSLSRDGILTVQAPLPTQAITQQ